MTNPLLELCRRVGVTIDAAAELTGRDRPMIRRALAENPVGDVRAVWEIAALLHTRLALRQSYAPLKLWIDRQSLNDLLKDETFRRCRKLLPWCETWRDLRKRMYLQKVHSGWTPNKISVGFTRSFIPTPKGDRQWHWGIVRKLRNKRGDKTWGNHKVVVPTAEFLREWREYLMTPLMADLIPWQPLGWVNHKIAWREDDTRIWIESAERVPHVIEAWAAQSLDSVGWLKGKWGIGANGSDPLFLVAAEAVIQTENEATSSPPSSTPPWCPGSAASPTSVT